MEEQAQEIEKNTNTTQSSENLSRPFVQEELRALGSVRATSASGLDGVDYYMLINLPSRWKEELLRVFTTVYWRLAEYHVIGISIR